MSEDLKTRMLTPRLAQEDVAIEGVGTVRVRALNRKEAVHVQLAGEDLEERDRRMLACGLIEPSFMLPWPKLHSVGDKPCEKCAPAGELQEASPAAELEPVTDKINELSGTAKDAGKKVYNEFEGNPDAEFRVLPGGPAEDDGRGNAGTDV